MFYKNFLVYLDESGGRRRANTASGGPHGKTPMSGVGRMAELTISPLSSEHSSPRSSHK